MDALTELHARIADARRVQAQIVADATAMIDEATKARDAVAESLTVLMPLKPSSEQSAPAA